MSSQTGYGSSMLFQTMNDDLNASLATADELSREFSSLLQEASSSTNAKSGSQTGSLISRDKPQSGLSGTSFFPPGDSSGSSNDSTSSMPYSPSSTASRSMDSMVSSTKPAPYSPVFHPNPLTAPQGRRDGHSPLPHLGPDPYLYGQMSPNQSPRTQRRDSPSRSQRRDSPSRSQRRDSPSRSQRCDSPSRYNRSPRGSVSYMERCPSPSPTAASFEQSPWAAPPHPSSNLLSPYDSNPMGRRSPRPDRSSSPRAFNQPMSSTLPRNFGGFVQADEGVQRQKSPGKWNETDLDASYERKPHHAYEKTEWLRQSVPKGNWRESNLDGPPPAPSAKKDPRSRPLQPSHGSLPRNARISVPPDLSSPAHSPYHPQPIISRISIPPASAQTRQRRPIPLSVIMRLQNPHWAAGPVPHPRVLGGEDMLPYLPASSLPREFLPHQLLPPQPPPPELWQPPIYSEVLKAGDVDAELERLDPIHHPMPVISETPSLSEGGMETPPAPRPLSPTRLQPVVAPEAQNQEIPDLEELLRFRAEIPRALKRRGSVDLSQPLKKASHYQPNQYKHLINKLFRRKGLRQKGEQGSETSSSSEGEDSPAMPPSPLPLKQTSTPLPPDHRNYHSILRRASREHRGTGRRARLSPLVLLLDGSLVGELETVQRAMQEMNDPSRPNDEGITALHNAICGGHYNVVDFLVRIGANVSAPDSHGWTPLHCSASCNDRPLCEFLVRNGAAVMARTESDGATAAQKCDPYAVGFEECESFLRGVEEAMGAENSGVLYALWNYPAQAADELSFKEGDMVTILQKPEGSDWWWASLCGREGFVPNNYFGLFPKVRPKSLC